MSCIMSSYANIPGRYNCSFFTSTSNYISLAWTTFTHRKTLAGDDIEPAPFNHDFQLAKFRQSVYDDTIQNQLFIMRVST